jgi:soluble lytic murein transglycosylase-like protein
MKKVLVSVAILATTICIASFCYTPPEPIKLNSAQRLYASIMTYAKQYEIPLHIAFNVARIETGYKGPFHDSYNHKQTSSAGALGPMQIMPQYASYYAGFKVKKPVLKDSIELNVEISMKMLRDWYNRYNDWGKATGAYNTGKPIINSYARNAVKKNYIDHWVRPDSTDTVPDTLAYLAKVDLVAFLKD